MKVLYVINGLGTGGAERSLAEMLPHLAEHGVEPTIVCLNGRSEGVHEEVLQAGFNVRVLRARHTAGCIRELRRLIQLEKPDIVHTTIFEADVTGRLAAWRTGVTVVTTLVNTSYDPVRLDDPNVSRWKLAAMKTIDGWTARRMTHHFHAITRAVKDHAVEHLGLDPSLITVIPRGRDFRRLGTLAPDRRGRVRASLGLPDDHRVVLNVARQEFQKGQRHLLEAFARLIPDDPDLVLLQVGREGNATGELQTVAAQAGLGDRVRFLGHRDDVPDLLAAADVFVFPSLYEGLGGALIEALAMGIPLVVSDLPATREVAGDMGGTAFVEPANPRALAEALRAVLDDLEAHRMAVAGNRGEAEARFEIAHVSGKLAELYQRILGGTPGTVDLTVLDHGMSA